MVDHSHIQLVRNKMDLHNTVQVYWIIPPRYINH